MLALAGVVSKLLGALYRIPLYPLLGAEGMGLFQMAYPIYALILVLSTTGINIAVSKLVAERVARGDGRGVWSVFRTSLILLAALGLFFSAALFTGAGYIATTVTRDPRAYLSIAAIAPAILFVAVMSAYRGLFQGMQMMTPTAVSQIVEQIVRVGTMMALAYVLLPGGVEYAAAGASFGAVTGAVAGLIYLLFVFNRGRREVFSLPTVSGLGYDAFETARQIIAMAIPVSIASGVLGIIQLVDMAVVPARLQASGIAPELATSLYGQLSGGALPLMNLPTIFTAALQVSLVPSVSEAAAIGDGLLITTRSRTALRMTFILMLPAMAGLYLLARPIPALLYGDPEVGTSLSALASGVLFLAVQQVTSGILQGMGLMSVPVRNLLWGAAVKFGLTWALTSIPALGIKGAAYGTSAGFLVAAVLNMFTLVSILGHDIVDVPGMFVKPGISTAVMGVTVVALHRWLAILSGRESVATLLAIFAGITTYIVTLILTGGMTSRDFEIIPRVGSSMAEFLVRLGLIGK
ncbi:MAG: polysaccharide biosynthesis protein [Firmicutes bacterium]|nr:polysaccharide biosynthesis protein [Bacillota bacterium]